MKKLILAFEAHLILTIIATGYCIAKEQTGLTLHWSWPLLSFAGAWILAIWVTGIAAIMEQSKMKRIPRGITITGLFSPLIVLYLVYGFLILHTSYKRFYTSL